MKYHPIAVHSSDLVAIITVMMNIEKFRFIFSILSFQNIFEEH